MKLGPPIYLALSGGGTRAMAFHTGLLKFLAEQNALERVKEISTVSGGTLLIGLMFSLNGYRWPNSTYFLSHIYPKLVSKLSDEGLEWKLFPRRLFNWRSAWGKRPSHWLSSGIRSEWGIDIKWGDLPKTPRWIVNTTSAETGKRFYFSNKWLKCYQIGETDAQQFLLADIMSASAALPGLIGPWVINVVEQEWKKAGKNEFEGQALLKKFHRLHLYDGGLYDNLGLEQFVDIGSGFKKPYRNGVVIVSDAGKPLENSFERSSFDPRLLLDLMDITLDQTRSLRVRDFNANVRAHPGSGVHIRIGATKAKLSQKANASGKRWLASQDILKVSDVKAVSKTSTRLHGFDEKTLNLLIQNGYETSLASCRLSGLNGISS